MKIPVLPLPTARIRSTCTLSPLIRIPEAGIPRISPLLIVAETLKPPALVARIPDPVPVGLHDVEQTVGPRMENPFRSMVTPLVLISMALVLGSLTVRLLDNR